MGSRNEQSRPQQINRKSHNGKPEQKEREREGGRAGGRERDILSVSPNLAVNWMTNCIGFVNLTTGTSDRGAWHWLAMLCPTNHNNTCPVMSQMWNNFDFLRCVWCYANSCLNLSKAQHRPITDQMRCEKTQRAYYSCSSWVESGEDTLICSGFWLLWVESLKECLQSYRRRIWVCLVLTVTLQQRQQCEQLLMFYLLFNCLM